MLILMTNSVDMSLDKQETQIVSKQRVADLGEVLRGKREECVCIDVFLDLDIFCCLNLSG